MTLTIPHSLMLGFWGSAPFPWLMLISSDQKDNDALIAHKQCHQEQQRRDGWLTFWWRYLTDKRTRLHGKPLAQYHHNMFKLSTRSFNNLAGVKRPLVNVVTRAIQLTEVDFVVIEGLRTTKRQQELVNQGASQTMNSKHLTGDAVDLVAWLGTIRWEHSLYFKIAEAMKQAAIENCIALRWGGAWTVPDIRTYSDTMEHAHEAYLALRRSQGRKAFIDMPHFELS